MKKIRSIYIYLLVGILAGCQSGDGGGGGETADQLVKDGWGAFISRDYKTAVSKFNQAITMNGALVDAYNGAGWSYAKLDSLNSSVTKFDTGLLRDSVNTEINAGLGIVQNALKAYQSSIQYTRSVLQQNPSWIFSRDNTINSSDLQVLLAEDFYAISSYDSSLAHIRILNSSFNADVSTFAGQKSLSQEIEVLRALYGS